MKDTAYPLFNQKFLIKAPVAQTVSIDYTRAFSGFTTGVSDIDQEMSREIGHYMLPITGPEDRLSIWRLFSQGARVSIVKESDTQVIYELINEHLQAWSSYIQNQLHTSGAPVDDLIELDRLANSVYRHARYSFTQEMVDNLFGAKPNLTMGFNLQQLWKGTEPTAAEQSDEDIENSLPKRQSMSDVFVRHKHRNQ